MTIVTDSGIGKVFGFQNPSTIQRFRPVRNLLKPAANSRNPANLAIGLPIALIHGMSRFRVVFESDGSEEVCVQLRVSADHDMRGEHHLTEPRPLLQRVNPRPRALAGAGALPYDYFESTQVEG